MSERCRKPEVEWRCLGALLRIFLAVFQLFPDRFKIAANASIRFHKLDSVFGVLRFGRGYLDTGSVAIRAYHGACCGSRIIGEAGAVWRHAINDTEEFGLFPALLLVQGELPCRGGRCLGTAQRLSLALRLCLEFRTSRSLFANLHPVDRISGVYALWQVFGLGAVLSTANHGRLQHPGVFQEFVHRRWWRLLGAGRQYKRAD